MKAYAAVLETSANVGTAFLPYVEKVVDPIGRIPRTYNIKHIYQPTSKESQLFFRSRSLVIYITIFNRGGVSDTLFIGLNGNDTTQH